MAGDAISFLMEHDKVSFPEAVQLLADRAGITIRREASAEAGPKGPPRVDVLNALDRAAAWFARQLQSDEGREALEYCRRRGLTDESIETFQLGYAPGDGGKIVRALDKAGFDLRVAEAAGLVRFSDRDGSPWGWFRHRLIFPIADTQGRVVGFGARLLGPEGEHTGPKYLNSPDSPVFNKRKLLYGLPQARAESNDTPMLVMEGYTDVILTRQAGVEGPVATLGTALGEAHLRTMRRFGREIVIVFDGDNAGLNAAERTVDLALTEDVPVSLVTLPPGRDPAEVVEAEGPQGFAELLGARREAIDFRIDRLRQRHDLATHAGQRAAGAEVVELASRIESAVARDLWFRRAAEAVGVSEEAIRKGAVERQQATARRAPDPAQGTREAPPMESSVIAELDCVIALLADPALAAQAEQIGIGDLLSDERCRALFAHVHAAAAQGVSPAPSELLQAFPDPSYRGLVNRLSDPDQGPEPSDRLRTAAWRLERDRVEAARQAWKQELQRAERAGDMDALRAAMEEIQGLDRRMAELGREVTGAEQ
jgi:DNA primase